MKRSRGCRRRQETEGDVLEVYRECKNEEGAKGRSAYEEVRMNK